MRLSLSHPSVVLLLQDLATGPANYHDLAAALGLDVLTVRRLVSFARRLGKVRIAGWERCHGGPRPVFGLGARKDAPKPAKLTRREVVRRFYRQHRVRILTQQRQKRQEVRA